MSTNIEAPTETVLAELGQRLRDQRIRIGYSQEDLARMANVSTRSIHHLETGGSSTTATLVKVLRAMGITDDLKAIAPLPSVSPMAALRQGRRAQRVSVPRKKK